MYPDVTGDGKVNVLDLLALIRAANFYGRNLTLGEAVDQCFQAWKDSLEVK